MHTEISKPENSAGEQESLSGCLADKIAKFGGSWAFLISFGAFLCIWIAANSFVYFWRPADPYPFIFLNLILSCLSSIQAPVIMMSQNRQEEKDRIRQEHDYQINLKAELEIQLLHQKIDQMVQDQERTWAHMHHVQDRLLNALMAEREVS